MFGLIILTTIVSLCFGDTWLLTALRNHIEICTIITSAFILMTIVIISTLKDNRKKWKLSDEDKDNLAHFHFGKMTGKQKKLMARSIHISSGLVFLRLSRMNLSEAIKDYEHNDFYLREQSSNDINILLKAIPNMEYTQKDETHTLRDWEVLLSEERIKSLKDKIRFERHRIHKYRGKSDAARQADLLNIPYLNYKRYVTFYNGIQKAIEQFGLNSKEVKQVICFTIDRIGDLQEWDDFVSTQKRLPSAYTPEIGRYATYHTNIIGNTGNTANLFYTKGSFYVMAYFDNITYEESDTFCNDDVTLYMYHYDFAYFLVFEFTKLRFAVPLNINDSPSAFNEWIDSEESEIRVNLIEKNNGRLVTSRVLHLKRMNVIKEKLKIQKTFNKAVIDAGVRDALSKSLDEMVYNGFILEVIKGDRNMKEGYLSFY